MTDVPDDQLLEQFSRNGSEEAFAALVRRHIALVHSVALRHTAHPQHAEDITQAVFVILARKAGTLGRKTVLPGWLYHTARLTAANLQRAEMRRVRREQEAFMQSTPDESATDALWHEISPQLDEAMAGLGTAERDALVLRYFQNKSMAEVGQALGLETNAAQKRVGRALDKLRIFFAKRGVACTGTIIAGVISTHSVQAVPAILTKSVTGVALTKGAAASASTLTLIKGALKIMAWTKAKTAIATGAVMIFAVGLATSIIAVHQKQAADSRAELTEAGNGAYGLYIHFGSATFANPGEKGTIPASRFAPASFNAQSWTHAAKQARMTFAVLTAKHESGFCLWDSPGYSYDVGSSPFKGDIIGDFIAACKAEGITPGVHYSIPDEFNEGAVRFYGPVVSSDYFGVIKKHITELHTLYPDLRVQIFDVTSRISQEQFDELRGIVKRLNPQCIVWGTTVGKSPNHDSDTIIAGWMWTPNARLNAAQSLSDHHQQSRADGKAFVLNVAPDRTGLIPDDQLAVLAQVK
ncbi:MAG TPA: sigma-70 family RNA polymerase sigma factor [Candidatus Paceibacterota bacterium]|nr:sigma-70 family RNA polymerase sigma factor [Candidatus Paceibacterota bacterium]